MLISLWSLSPEILSYPKSCGLHVVRISTLTQETQASNYIHLVTEDGHDPGIVNYNMTKTEPTYIQEDIRNSLHSYMEF